MDKTTELTTIALDYASQNGIELTYLCNPDEEVLVYTPTYIWHGKVTQVGPLGFELDARCKLVYESGTPEEQVLRNWKQEEILFARQRFSWCGVISVTVLSDIPDAVLEKVKGGTKLSDIDPEEIEND